MRRTDVLAQIEFEAGDRGLRDAGLDLRPGSTGATGICDVDAIAFADRLASVDMSFADDRGAAPCDRIAHANPTMGPPDWS